MFYLKFEVVIQWAVKEQEIYLGCLFGLFFCLVMGVGIEGLDYGMLLVDFSAA